MDELTLSDMETTDDKTMVKVFMTDEALRKNEPQGRFIGLDQALELEAHGKCRIKRQSDRIKYETTKDGRIVVEHLLKPLISSYGLYGVYPLEDAEIGQKRGKWRIMAKGESRKWGGDSTKVLSPQAEVSWAKQASIAKRVRKKKIAWVQDKFFRGGAEISSELVRRVGTDCGFAIEEITPFVEVSTMQSVLSEADLIVVNNIWGFGQPQMDCLLRAIYSERIPYVKYEHDHRELDRREFSRRLFQHSRLNIFLSPLHLKNHKERLGCDGIALPLAIDVELFKPVDGIERKPGTAAVCNLRNFKQWSRLQEYIDRHREIEFIVFTNDILPVSGANVKARRKVPFEEMPATYSEFEYLVHILDGWGAGERVVFEAALAGCKVVANERVGHTSWGREIADNDGFRDWLRRAPFEFWKEIDRLC